LEHQPDCAVECLVANNGRPGKPCQGRQPPKAGAEGQPLQGLLVGQTGATGADG